METNNSSIFSLVWALMPLSTDELEQIPLNHRIRPYLIFEINDEFYGFPCTSNINSKKNRYSNGQAILSYSEYEEKTLVKLEKVFIIPEEYYRGYFKPVNLNDENEIIKKIQANFQFSNYPQEVINFFESRPVKITCSDMIIRDNQLYSVVGMIYRQLLLVPIYKYPINNTVECSTDGLMYYADVDNTVILPNDNTFKYCTKLNDLQFGKNNKSRKDIRKLMNHYFILPRIKCDCSYNRFNELNPGMIIDYINNDIPYKMIILTKNDSEFGVITGDANDFYSNFNYMTLPINENITFEVTGVLSSDRLNQLREKFLSKDYMLKLKQNNKK
jgi:hypothetical protein